MNLIGRYENRVSKHPKKFIIILVVITLILSFFASQMDMETGEDDFQPDTEIAEANSMIRDEYGAEGEQVNVISVAENNVLSLESLVMQAELERRIIDSQKISRVIQPTSESPTGTLTPARLIAQTMFIQRALEEFQGGNQLTQQDVDPQRVLRKRASTLTPEEIIEILEGGTIEIKELQLELDFQEYYPQMLDELYETEFLPLEDILSFLLSKDYDRSTHSAGKSITSVFIMEDASSEDVLEAEKALQSIASDVESSEYRLRVLGNELINEEISDASGTNIAILMPMAFIFVIVVLALMYRNITDTVLNLLSLVMAIIWVYGIGVILDLNLGNPMMTTVPVLIIGLGIDYGIHFTSRYKEELEEGKNISDALTKTGATVGFAILLTTVTTVVGFMSNLSSNISTIRHFGILCSVGIISAFILMLTFFPAAKSVIDSRKKKKGKKLFKEEKKKVKKKDKKTIGDRFWSKIGEPESFCEADRDCVNNGLGLGAIAARTPVPVLIVVLLITSTGVYGGLQLEAEYDFRDFLPEDLEVTETVNMLVEDFDFSEETIYILVEGDITNPEVFRNIPVVQDQAMESEYAVTARNPRSPYTLAVSMATEGSSEYNESFETFWTENIVDEEGAIREDIDEEDVTEVYNMMMEFQEDEAMQVLNREDGDYKGFILRIPVDTQEEEKALETQQDMEDAAEPFMDLDLDRVLVTGGPIVSQSTFESISQGQIQTLAITFAIALIILIILYSYLGKGPLLGAVTILPLVFVITWTFGAMYFFNIPLNPVTVTIAAITVGLGIDFSIHLTERFNEDTENIPHPECALCVSASHTGSALFGSAATTIIGFGILSFAIIPPLAQFGQVSAMSIFFAFLAAVFVLPTFLLLWFKFKYSR
ncbi:MAG: efflux RND transporter permease subunit [Candidatus Natronoplasma sp.]